MHILDIFFPKRCIGCGRIGRYICTPCRALLPVTVSNEAICPVCGHKAFDGYTHPGCQTALSADGLISFFHYRGIVRNAIKTLKYRFVSDLAHEFVSAISDQSITGAINRLPMGSVLVPIPLHSSRQKMRGFNQAEVLGEIVSGRLRIFMSTDILTRVKKTEPQAEKMHRADRLRAMHGVFAVKPGVKLPDDIVLFDDVFTTGATMREAVKVLKRAGTARVWCMAMAH